MRIATRHFYFAEGRYGWEHEPRWYRRALRIGLIGWDAPQGMVPFRFCFSLDYWLIPNFIWYRTELRQQVDKVEYQDCIIGIHSWPFQAIFSRGDRACYDTVA